jgi:hypothetical protein
MNVWAACPIVLGFIGNLLIIDVNAIHKPKIIRVASLQQFFFKKS